MFQLPRGKDVGPHRKLSCCAWFCLLVAVARLAGRWCFWRLFSCFPGAGAPRLFGGFGFSFSLSQRQLLGVDRNGVFTEAARYICHLSRVWANGVLGLGDGFRVLNPMGFFAEAVRCDNCEARSAHGARARTQDPNFSLVARMGQRSPWPRRRLPGVEPNGFLHRSREV